MITYAVSLLTSVQTLTCRQFIFGSDCDFFAEIKSAVFAKGKHDELATEQSTDARTAEATKTLKLNKGN